MLHHGIHSRFAAYVRRRACLQFIFARPLLACLLMVAGLGAVSTSQATVHATRKAPHHWIHLRWSAPTQSSMPVAGYNIYRSDDGGKAFRKVNRMPVTKTEYNDRSVRGGVSYIYLVKSVDHMDAESGPSNEIRLRVP